MRGALTFICCLLGAGAIQSCSGERPAISSNIRHPFDALSGRPGPTLSESAIQQATESFFLEHYPLGSGISPVTQLIEDAGGQCTQQEDHETDHQPELVQCEVLIENLMEYGAVGSVFYHSTEIHWSISVLYQDDRIARYLLDVQTTGRGLEEDEFRRRLNS